MKGGANKYDGQYQTALRAYYTALLSAQFSLSKEHTLSFVIPETHTRLPVRLEHSTRRPARLIVVLSSLQKR